VPDLVKLLKDENAGVRRIVVAALGNLRVKEVASDLLKLLRNEDEDNQARRSAAEALVKLGVKDVAPDLVKLMNGEKGDRKIFWVEALCRLGSREGIPSLLEGEEFPLHRASVADRNNDKILWSRSRNISPLHHGRFACLNAVSQPELWQRLENTEIGQLEGTRRSILEHLAKEVGLKVDLSNELSGWLYGSVRLRHRYNRFFLITLKRILDDSPYAFVLEPDRILILTHDEMIEYWKAWWKRIRANEQK
jgi:hypothetical protein